MIPWFSKLPVVVTLAVVEIASVRLWGPLLMLEIVDPFRSGKEQAAPAGSPAPQERATDSGKPESVGATRIEYLTASPDANVVGVLEVALTEKSFTVAEFLIGAVVPPGKLRLAELPMELDPVFGAFTVTVTFAAKLTLCVAPHEFAVVKVVRVELFTVPNVQINSPLVTAVPQVPWLALALVDPELVSSLSVNTTPETGSP